MCATKNLTRLNSLGSYYKQTMYVVYNNVKIQI